MSDLILRWMRADLLLITLVLAIAVVFGCPGAGEKLPYPTIGAELEPLRSSFNADPDSVKAVLLVAPT